MKIYMILKKVILIDALLIIPKNDNLKHIQIPSVILFDV